MAKGRSTLVLLGSILVLGAFIFIQHSWRARVPTKEYRRIQFFDLRPDTLVSIQFEYTNLVVECVKENGIWMTGGSERGLGRADVALVHKLLAGLNSIGKGTTITAKQLQMRGLDASEYGLAEPSIRIVAVDNKGSHTWWIGRKAPLSETLYAKQGEDEDIYTISSRLLEVVPTQSDALRDRTLFSGKTAGTRRIELRGTGGFVQILKDPKEGWQIQQPVAAAADPQGVEELLEKMYRLRIEEFVAENVSDFAVYGLQGDTGQMALGGADGTSRMLMIGDEISDQPGMVYARRTDDTSVFSLRSEVLNLLDTNLNDLRDVRVLPLPAAKVSYISVERGSEQIELVQEKSGKWSITKPISWEANPRAVEKVLKFWDIAVITDFNETNSTELVEWVVSFGSDELGKTNRLDILQAMGNRDGLLIRRNGESPACRINLPFVPDSILDPLKYKNQTIWKVQEDEIQKISVEREGQPPQILERLADGTFVPGITNVTVQAHSTRVQDVVNELTEISASDYVAYNPSDLSIYGLEEASISLYMGLTGTNQLGRVLLIGQEAAEGYYAMVKGRDVIFLLAKPIVDIFSADLVVEKEQIAPTVE